MDAMETMYDAVIVGGGPAGLSAALYLGRARRRVLLVDAGHPRNAAVAEMHGFFTQEGSSPGVLRERTLRELREFPLVSVVHDEVCTVNIVPAHFDVGLSSGRAVQARRLLLATGMQDVLPKVPGIAERWGKSVFVCPFCDGWEVRDKPLAVFGECRDAVELAQELYGWSHALHVIVQRNDLTELDRRWLQASGSHFSHAALARVDGSGTALESVSISDGTRIAAAALFLSAPLRQRSLLAERLGCEFTADNEIAVDAEQRTTVKGCFAAGDAVTHLHQVIIAASSGAKAAIAINTSLLEAEAQALVEMPGCAV